MQNTNGSPELRARTHADASALFRRPFAPGAIGFRAMTKVPYNGDPSGGAQVAAYIGAQSVLQRLNAVVPGRWRMEFKLLQPSNGAKKRYMACRLIIGLPFRPGGRDVEAVYEDVGELEVGSPAGLKALYSDARKRAGVAAGIGAYLYTALAPVVLPIGSEDRHVQVGSRPGGEDLVLSPATEAWLRERYALQMASDEVSRDLGEILTHGEPQCGIGQGEVAEHATGSPGEAFWAGEQTPDQVNPVAADGRRGSETAPAERPPKRATAWCTSTSAAAGRTPRNGGSE
jgi:hypothetical protein